MLCFTGKHLIALGAFVATMVLVVAAVADDGMPSAASDEHLWLVKHTEANRDGDRPRLFHHAAAMGGPFFTRGPSVSQLPEAVAASGNRVWLVFPPQQSNGELYREVFTVRIERDPAMGMYHPHPRDRLTLTDSLPGTGRLAGFVAGDRGPVALLLPRQHEKVQVRRENNEQSPPSSGLAAPRLLQLQSDGWSDLAMPELLEHADADWPVHLGFDGSDRRRLNVLTTSPESPGESVLMRRDREEEVWSSTDIALDARSVQSLLRFDDRLAAVTMHDVTTGRIHYLRSGVVLDLVEFPIPAGDWALQAMQDGFHLIAQGPDGQLTVQIISPMSGSFGELQTMRDQPLPASKLWHTGLMLAVSVIAVLIVLLVRPGGKNDVQLPEHKTFLPALPRLAALLVDLVPGALIAMVVLQVGPAELLRLPLMSESLDQAGPHLLMLLITIIHCTLFEMTRGATLGKMLVGAGVMSVTGQWPNPRQVLARNGVKLMILIVPPLAIFVVLNPHMQGFNDMAARTVVLRDADESNEGEQES